MSICVFQARSGGRQSPERLLFHLFRRGLVHEGGVAPRGGEGGVPEWFSFLARFGKRGCFTDAIGELVGAKCASVFAVWAAAALVFARSF